MSLDRLLIEGERACFPRRELVEDLVTYDVITPAALERMLAAVFPGSLIVATSVSVLMPIVKTWGSLTTSRGARRYHALENVAYVITLEGACLSELTPTKFEKALHLGLRDFPARVCPLEGDLPVSAYAGTGTRDLGWLPYSYETAPSRISYAQAMMVDGLIDLTRMVGDGIVR